MGSDQLCSTNSLLSAHAVPLLLVVFLSSRWGQFFGRLVRRLRNCGGTWVENFTLSPPTLTRTSGLAFGVEAGTAPAWFLSWLLRRLYPFLLGGRLSVSKWWPLVAGYIDVWSGRGNDPQARGIAPLPPTIAGTGSLGHRAGRASTAFRDFAGLLRDSFPCRPLSDRRDR